MIVVRITMNVFPEKQKEVSQTLLSLIEMPGKEKGCLDIGNYSRKFSVSNTIDPGNIWAILKDGVLSLTLLKAPEAKPREIPVK